MSIELTGIRPDIAAGLFPRLDADAQIGKDFNSFIAQLIALGVDRATIAREIAAFQSSSDVIRFLRSWIIELKVQRT